MQYPAVNVYCEKIVNSLTEKFRTFSGSVQMTIELRHSQDRLDGLQDELEMYVGRGDAGAEREPRRLGQRHVLLPANTRWRSARVKHGGKNFIQVAKITFEIGVSRS